LDNNIKRRPNILFTIFELAVFFGITQTTAFAQTITATLTGEVKDPNGAVVPGASVIVQSVETGLSKSAETNDDGRYTIVFLPPGTYNITVEKSGFAKTERQNVRLETGQTAGLNIELGVSAGEVSVDVESGEVPLLQTESSALDTTIENKLVEDLPSGERSALAFINLVPGAIDAGFAQGRGEGLNENGNAQGPIGSPGNRNFFDSNFSVNGGRSSTNDILLDGVSNTVGDFNGVAVSPPQDSIRELKVVAGSYSSEYGRSGGGVVSITTKSGGNQFRGALYEYYQAGRFNANGWQRNRRGNLANGNAVLPRIDILRHQYGGALGGPVYFLNFGEGEPGEWIRKLNKTFFFFNYEGRYEDNPFSREITVPTQRMRTGDFGELLGGTRTGVTNPDGTPARFGQIYNPYTFGATVAGRRNYFTNNDLSNLPTCSSDPAVRRTGACLDPVALRLLQFLPLPNQPGLVNNYVFSDVANFRRDIYATRIDHTFSEKHSFFVRFSYEKRFTTEPNYFGDSIAANIRKVRDSFYNTTINDVYSLTPTLVNNFRYGYTRVRANQIPESLGFDPTSLGLPSSLSSLASVLKFPDFTIGGGAAGSTLAGELTGGQIGGAGNDQPRDTHTFANSLTWVKGNQTWKFGGEYRIYRFYPFQFFNPTGSFSFNRTWTSGPAPNANQTPVDTSGSSFASFLLGLPSGGNFETVVPVTIFHNYGAGFVQNDWKVTPNLTLNLGVRWDYETATEETHGLITNFDINGPAGIQGQQNIAALVDPFVREVNLQNLTNLRGTLNFVDGPQTDTNWNRFAPRVGFAYRINDKTTLRGGYGLFYVPISLEGTTTQGTNFNTALPQSSQTSALVNSGTATWTTYLTNPFPNPTNPLQTIIGPAPGTTLGGRTRLGQQVFAVEPERANPYNQQWNLVVQRQLAKNFVIDLAYVGSRGVHLPIQSLELNQISPETLAYVRANFNRPGSCGANPCANITAFLNQTVANPLAGTMTGVNGATLNGATVARIALLRPFPQYTSVQLFRPHIGYSTYHALQINLQKRFSDGLSFVANYTWSKSLDTGGVGNGAAFLDATAIQDIYNFQREYSYSTLDVPHRIAASWTYELPFGKNKMFGKNWGKLAQAFLGGWQTSGSFTWQRGAPFPIISNGFAVGIGQGVRRPDRLDGDASLGLSTARENVRNGGVWFDTTRFAVANEYQFGNAARTYNDIRRDNYKNLNISLLKNFYWDEGKQKLQLRVEALNAFNWVVFGTPGNNVQVPANATQTGFGQVRTQGNTPRNMQFVVRYTF
jgi:outer membrane receptor protein involved in Fe transport